MQYDMSPVSAEWIMPPWKAGNLASAVMYPSQDVEVNATPRTGFKEATLAGESSERTKGPND